jgi:tetratricopeptide (TPR) repeat protein
MKLLFAFILTLSCFNIKAQNIQIDSLESELKNHTYQDTVRFNILNQLANQYHYIQPEKGLARAEEALELAKFLDKKDLLASAFKNKAYNLIELSQDSLALNAYNNVISLLRDLEDNKNLGIAYFNKALIQYEFEDYEKAIKNNKEAFSSFQKIKDTLLMNVALNSIALSQMNQNDYLNAIDTYLTAMSLYEKSSYNNSYGHAQVFLNIGLVYNRLEKYDIALEYYNKGLKIAKDNNVKIAIANALSNIGNVYDNKKEPLKAIGYYEESFDIMKELDNKYGIASSLTNIGIAYIQLEDFNKSIKYLNQSKPLWEEIGNKTNLSIVLENIGKSYATIKYEETGKRDDLLIAKSNLDQAVKIAEEINNLRRMSLILSLRASVLYKLKNFENAYKDNIESQKLKEEYLSIEKVEDIARREAKYKSDKKEFELKANFKEKQLLKDQEIERQKLIKNAISLGGVGLLSFGIFAFILFRKKQNEKNKTLKAEFDFKLANTELKALRNQMDPHFISNSLSSINDYLYKNDIESASDYLIKFSKLMRSTLEKSSEQEILLEEEISILKAYLDIEQKRFENSFTYHIYIDDNLEKDNILIPPMILQPFVENAIIHGISNIDYPGLITISYKKRDNMLICEVEDNGIGSKKSLLKNSNKDKKSLSIEITKGRLEIINKLHNTNASLEFTDIEKDFKVEITLPFIEKY